MAKTPRSGTSGKKKPRHTAAQKKAARLAREKSARSQLKGRRDRPVRDDQRSSGGTRESGRYDDRRDRYDDRRDRSERQDRRPSRGEGRDFERRQRPDGGWDARSGPGRRDRDDRGYGRRGREDRGGDGRRDEGGYGHQGRNERDFDRDSDRRGSRNFDRRNERDGDNRYQGRGDDRYQGRGDDRYQGRRDDRGYGSRGRDQRGGDWRRDERGYGRTSDRRDDRGSSWQRDGRRDERRDDRAEGGNARREHTWRAHREERDGYNPQRGRHEGRSWEERPRRDRPIGRERDDFDRSNRFDRSERRDRFRSDDRFDGRPDDAFVEAEAERDEADAAYQQRKVQPVLSDGPVEITADNGFATLGLHENLVQTLARTGITEPFPIQAATIPDALAGKDLLGRGRTGSGKTMAFGLPMLHRLMDLPRAVPHRPRALILSPTRELAMQIVDALAPLMRAVDKRFLLVAGGMSYTPQLKALERGVDVLVATPGRLIDLMERSAADLSDIAITILDEADHMAEMGFVEAIAQVLDATPAEGQRMLFSATLDHGVDKVAKTYLKDPVTHSTDDAQASVTTMDHHVFLVHPHHKKPITAAIANRPGRTVVFCRTKLGADRIAMQLRESGVFAAALHGGLNQAQRTRVLDAFKSGDLPVLVATDVAARGIHVDDVSLVLQVDPPADHKDYLHRSGRTARAGEEGVVVTLALPHQKKQVARLLDAAGVDTNPRSVAPEDVAVIETAGGRVPDADPIPQSRLDEILRPRRPQGRGRYGSQGGQRRNHQGYGGQRGRGSRGRDDGGRGYGERRRYDDREDRRGGQRYDRRQTR